jgi:general secretion pathway protein G
MPARRRASEAAVESAWYRMRPAIVFAAGCATGSVAAMLILSDSCSSRPCPGFSARGKSASDIRAIDDALNAYAVANGGRFPPTLDALVTPDANGRSFLDASRIPRDGWGRAYAYDPPGPELPRARVRSFGRDGRPGGEGDDADIDSTSPDRAR